MNIYLSYEEANSLIRDFFKIPLRVTYASNGHFVVTYRYRSQTFLIGEVEKDISLKLAVKQIDGNRIILSAESGLFVRTLLPILLNAVADRRKLDFLSASGTYIGIDLKKIPALASLLKKFNVREILFGPEYIDIRIEPNM